jgi:hypothetical protein
VSSSPALPARRRTYAVMSSVVAAGAGRRRRPAPDAGRATGVHRGRHRHARDHAAGGRRAVGRARPRDRAPAGAGRRRADRPRAGARRARAAPADPAAPGAPGAPGAPAPGTAPALLVHPAPPAPAPRATRA